MRHNEFYIEQIRNNPNNDQFRFDYANWLKSEGEPYGEFIEVQCKLFELPIDSSEYNDLLARQQQLLDQYQSKWFGQFEKDNNMRFYKGFVTAATISLDEDDCWNLYSIKDFDPFIEELSFINAKNFFDNDFDYLKEEFPKIKRIIISHQGLTDSDIKPFFDYFEKEVESEQRILEYLDLSFNELTEFPNKNIFPKLERLNLSHNKIGLKVIWKSIFKYNSPPAWDSVNTKDLFVQSYHPISIYQENPEYNDPSPLKFLDISYNNFCNEDDQAWYDDDTCWAKTVNSHLFRKLVELDVSGNHTIDNLDMHLDKAISWDNGEDWRCDRGKPADVPNRIICKDTDIYGDVDEITREEYCKRFE